MKVFPMIFLTFDRTWFFSKSVAMCSSMESLYLMYVGKQAGFISTAMAVDLMARNVVASGTSLRVWSWWYGHVRPDGYEWHRHFSQKNAWHPWKLHRVGWRTIFWHPEHIYELIQRDGKEQLRRSIIPSSSQRCFCPLSLLFSLKLP